MPVRMIATDLDGTLLRTDKSVSAYTLSVLDRCRDRGMTVVLATARSEKTAERYIEIIRPDAVISNGGALLRYGRRILFKRVLSMETSDRLIESCLADPQISQITVETDTGFYWDSRHFTNAGDYPHAICYDFREPLHSESYKITVEIFDPDTAAVLADRFSEVDMLPFAGEGWYRYAHREATKMNAIRALADHLDIDLPLITAFGDDYNDIEMLRCCGCGVAVSNAIPEIIEIADYVTGSNADDGVARFLEKMMADEDIC